MTSAWVQHCKNYAKEHNCSYKDAMKQAKATYNPTTMSGGSLKSVVKKANKLGHKIGSVDVDRVVDKVNNKVQTGKRKVENSLKKVDEFDNLVGTKLGKAARKVGNQVNSELKKQKVGRKAKNTAKMLASKAVDGLSITEPEIGVPLELAKKVIGSGKKGKLGTGKNPYLTGGSFRVASEGFRGGCHSCSGGKLAPGHTESSLLNPSHPASHPVKVKSYSRSQYEN